jgi:putative heme-binding domain-containing protein
MYASALERGWNTQHKLALLRFYEQARSANGGASLRGYLDHAAEALTANLTAVERERVLAGGAELPSTALLVLAKLPPNPGKAMLRQIKALDRQLEGIEGEAVTGLRIGAVAVLGRSRDEHAMTYLRDVYARDPSRREIVAMGLAQNPRGANWTLLVQSLAILDGAAAREVLAKLAGVDRKPDGPEPIRQAILCGLRAQETAAGQAVRLLEKWTGQRVSQPDDAGDAALAKWQTWFAQTYPNELPPRLADDPADSRWTYQELLGFLDSPEGKEGDPNQGAVVFGTAQCAKCHRAGDQGERVGPDLTAVSQRFHTKELLQSVLFPSHVVADQYASKTVTTTDGRAVTGLLITSGRESVIVVDSSGDKIEIRTDQIEDIASSNRSIMPEGLLNSLSLEQIADLFALLGRPSHTVITSRRRVRSSH